MVVFSLGITDFSTSKSEPSTQKKWSWLGFRIFPRSTSARVNSKTPVEASGTVCGFVHGEAISGAFGPPEQDFGVSRILDISRFRQIPPTEIFFWLCLVRSSKKIFFWCRSSIRFQKIVERRHLRTLKTTLTFSKLRNEVGGDSK